MPCPILGYLCGPSGVQRAPFEPPESVKLKTTSLKTALLTALTSVKRVYDLQAFLFSEMCLGFGQADFHIFLRNYPG